MRAPRLGAENGPGLDVEILAGIPERLLTPD